MQEVDAIIVGGGLAGIHLALAMNRKGFNPLVVNRPDAHSSSRIAAGIINPITGRRFALTWLYEKLEPAFLEVYEYWQNKWESRFFGPKNIYRSVPDNKLVNDLDAKLTSPAFETYCRKMTEAEINESKSVVQFKTPGYVMKGYQLDTVAFLDQAIAYLTKKGQYMEADMDKKHYSLAQNKYEFKGYRTDKLIWATGAAIVEHPHFAWVKMNPNKGEILHLNTTPPHLDHIVKQSTFFVPLAQDEIWIGSYNSWNPRDKTPTKAGLDYLESRAKFLNKPYQITAHHAAIRPAVEDRRPVIGAHPDNPTLFLFNGFGSKGSSLIPYFAENLVEHITNQVEICPEVSVSRYWS
ncbi:FAD-binding oxidoreductase [Membranicola marinus]|uniref:FAD-binding oxidoreductase n=1 Tax=Membranihabitans marinus TaxID=1227546 RepID=A0A953HJZ2_9BACT|nr:FAD-binding oxidoreductase [Membranihabitans marinus]MBY5957097.1 FAD-binding oxidoreductase [Membranihabitans marinus]